MENPLPQTLIEKIVQKFAVGLNEGQIVRSGDYIMFSPAYIMTHDNTGAVIPKFKSIGAKKLFNPRQVVHTLDHNVQDTSEKNLEKYKKIEEFSKGHGADFYPAGRGIGHQIMCEEGYAWPGTMVVASDSHSNIYGGLGCLGTPIVRTDAAAIWATGKTWWQIPPIVNVELTGKLNPGVYGKDVIIALCGYFNNDDVLNCAIEFTGEGVGNLDIDDRLAISNMTTEWGAMAGVFPIDEKTLDWLEKRNQFISVRGLQGVHSDADGNGAHPRINAERINALRKSALSADINADYAKHIKIDLGSIVPFVSGPNSVKKYSSAADLSAQKVKVNKAYLVSCVNSRLSDIEIAAAVVKGKKINPDVKFYIAAASSEVENEAKKSGAWDALIEAGAIALPPGCGPCIGLGTGLLEDGEVGISATNRNFKGRMGSPSALAYLASPAVVAYSALSGYIDYEKSNLNAKPTASIRTNDAKQAAGAKVEIIDGFPGSLEGELIFCHQDNLNTDGIYPGKYTYNDDFTPEQQASVVMENYDPEFGKIVEKGNILVGGYNFGTGSSREQAATALKYRGISLVIAGSFNETYKRNAINNGYLLIECPELINDLKVKHGSAVLTVKTGVMAKIDFRESKITTIAKTYSIGPVGKAAQELIVADGLEKYVAGIIK